jgi:hypothetical protein
MRMNRASEADEGWFEARLRRECERFDTDVIIEPDNSIVVRAR